jgi:hypothetical protein
LMDVFIAASCASRQSNVLHPNRKAFASEINRVNCFESE